MTARKPLVLRDDGGYAQLQDGDTVAGVGTSDAVPEGVLNLYFTDARARAAVSTWIDVSLPPYSANRTGLVDTLAALQAAIDAAAALGGGGVYMPPGIYLQNGVLELKANVHLMGAGMTASVIRRGNTPGVGRVISGVTVYCTIGMIGVAGAKVSRLGVDLGTLSAQSNGIQIGESGAAVRSAGCTVEACRVTGWNTHQYLIYNKCADRTLITGNYVTGHTSIPATDTAAIEIYGGVDVIVSGNVCELAAYGITFVQESITADSDLIDCLAIANTVRNCTNGLNAVSATGRTNRNSRFVHNTVSGCTNRGITIALSDGVCSGAFIDGNTVRTCVTAIIADSNGATPTALDTLVISNNRVQGGSIELTGARDAILRGNSISDAPAAAISISGSSGVLIGANLIESPGTSGVALLGTSADISILGNMMTGIGSVAVVSSGAGNSDVDVIGTTIERTSGATNVSVIDLANVAVPVTVLNTRIKNPPATLHYSLPAGARSDTATNTLALASAALDNLAIKGGGFVRLNGAVGAATMTGIAGGNDGDQITFYVNTGSQMTLLANNAASAVGNRISLGPGSSLVVAAYKMFTLRFSRPDNFWMLLSVSP